MRYTSLQDWLQWQQTLHPKAIDMSLSRIAEVANLMGIGQAHLVASQAKLITVGGTNGKGSCVRVLEQALLAQGKSTGAFTSPHVLRYNERIRINGSEAGDDAIVAAFAAIDHARNDISLTYFEFGTLAAAYLFKNADVDYWLLEVGLGGRLDSVNIWSADVAIITSIDIDHVQWLGDNREDIGREKAGIFRPGQTALCADLAPPRTVIDAAQSIGAHLGLAGSDFSWQTSADGWLWRCLGEDKHWLELPLPKPRLPEPSVAAALAALVALNVLPSQAVLTECLAKTTLAGRFQTLKYNNVPLVLDVAHNPHAVRLLLENLQALAPKRRPVAVFAALADKDLKTIIATMAQAIERWHLPPLADVQRAAEPSHLKAILDEHCCQVRLEETMELALQHAVEDRTEDDLVIVFGSFHTIESCLLAMQSTSAYADSAQ
ncbi:bifunctional tetrahydrofolate synthase/dihydrofolate synthase [Halioxenophilus aromaticivorans]|uniref:Dihydrofolate synthase/folylpolyglutamate synthase n=1 Tax=Halioxenophilus aromaticivorans TaxID=1306992 RepID=A0AAV3U821_9ALTE